MKIILFMILFSLILLAFNKEQSQKSGELNSSYMDAIPESLMNSQQRVPASELERYKTQKEQKSPLDMNNKNKTEKKVKEKFDTGY